MVMHISWTHALFPSVKVTVGGLQIAQEEGRHKALRSRSGDGAGMIENAPDPPHGYGMGKGVPAFSLPVSATANACTRLATVHAEMTQIRCNK